MDKKTTGSIGYFQKYNSKVSDSHKAQINAYGALLKKCYGMEAKRGCVMYISNQVVKETRDITINRKDVYSSLDKVKL